MVPSYGWGALVGAAVNAAIYTVNAAVRDDVVFTKKGLAAAALSGAIGGGIGTIATPIGAVIKLGGELVPLGTAVVNAGLGAASSVIGTAIDPFAKLTVNNVVSSAAFGALGGTGGKNVVNTVYGGAGPSLECFQ